MSKHFKEGGTDYKRIDEEAQAGFQCYTREFLYLESSGNAC